MICSQVVAHHSHWCIITGMIEMMLMKIELVRLHERVFLFIYFLFLHSDGGALTATSENTQHNARLLLCSSLVPAQASCIWKPSPLILLESWPPKPFSCMWTSVKDTHHTWTYVHLDILWTRAESTLCCKCMELTETISFGKHPCRSRGVTCCIWKLEVKRNWLCPDFKSTQTKTPVALMLAFPGVVETRSSLRICWWE